MHTDIRTRFSTLQFRYLPPFAAYLLQQQLLPFTQHQLQLSRRLQLPLLRPFEKMPEADLLQLVQESNREFLMCLAQNRGRQQIAEAVQKWTDNQLPIVDKYEVVADDITLMSYVRKQTFLHFIPTYSNNLSEVLALIEEIDVFITAAETASANTYITLLQNRINEHSHFIQQTNQTMPGAIYVFDLPQAKAIYTNGKLKEVLGYDQDELNKMGASVFNTLIHPDDLRLAQKGMMQVTTLQDGQINSYKCRVRLPDGLYRWICIYESVFKRDGEGRVTHTIAIALNVDKEKRMADQLAKRERQLLEAQEIAQIGSFVWDMETKELEGTPKLYHLLEAAKNDLAAIWRKIHEEDQPKLQQALDEALRTGRFECEFRYQSSGGERIYWSKAVISAKEEGSGNLLTGTLMDVTARNRTMENLRQSEQRFKQAEALAHLGHYELDMVANKVKMSDELFRIYGLEPQEAPIDYSLVVKMRHAADNKTVSEAVRQALEDGQPYDFYYRIITNNNTLKIVRARGQALTGENGKISKLVGTLQDVTEQQAAENELLEKQNFIQKITDATPTILYLYHPADNRFMYINREVFYVLGYTAEEVLALGPDATSLLYHPEDSDLLPERPQSSKKFQHTDSMIQYECRMQNKSGDWCWVLVREVIFKTDEKGAIVEILGAALDITKRKEMERVLMQNAFQLEQSNASLEEFAYVASHDLKEPLRKISTFGDRLLQTQMEQLTVEGKNYLNKIIDAAQRMQLMINDLLSISMITGDRAFEPFSLQSILADVLQTLEYKIEQKNAVIQADELPTIHIIPSQFRQLFQNLLSNSLKFVRDGVSPVIAITHSFLLPHEVEHLQLPKTDAYLKLQFKDNGIGFEEEYAAKIFAIFQRLHGRSEYEGTGIGLAICKKIVEHHGGIIYATGHPQKGSTFTIILPV